MIKEIMTTKKLDKIDANETNQRLPQNEFSQELMLDIGNRGLTDRPVVWSPNGSDNVTVVQGTRRRRALIALKEQMPDVFAKHFPNDEIPVILLEGATLKEVLIRQCDQGQQEGLKHPEELYMTLCNLFTAECTEEDIAVQAGPLFDSISPMKASVKAEIKEIEEQIAEARSLKLESQVRSLEKQLRKRHLDYRKGMIQTAKARYRCPDVVQDAKWYHATVPQEVRPLIDGMAVVPNPTGDQCKALAESFAKDLEIKDEKGNAKYNKRIPGPHFNEAWNKLIEKAEAKAKGEKKPSRKSMSAKDLDAEVNDHLCVGFKLLTRKHASDKTVDLDEVKVCDNEYYHADLVIEGDPKLWAQVVKSAEKIEKSLREKQEAEGKAEETAEATA